MRHMQDTAETGWQPGVPLLCLYCTLREPVLARTGAVFRANLFLKLLLRWYHHCIELDHITR